MFDTDYKEPTVKAFGRPVHHKQPIRVDECKEDLQWKYALIQGRLADINRKLKNNELMLNNRGEPQDYRTQEIISEKKSLEAALSGLSYAIAVALPSKDDEKHKQMVEGETDYQLSIRLQHIKNFERQALWRQAKLRRLDLLDLRKQIRQQFSY